VSFQQETVHIFESVQFDVRAVAGNSKMGVGLAQKCHVQDFVTVSNQLKQNLMSVCTSSIQISYQFLTLEIFQCVENDCVIYPDHGQNIFVDQQVGHRKSSCLGGSRNLRIRLDEHFFRLLNLPDSDNTWTKITSDLNALIFPNVTFFASDSHVRTGM
jgi:hypothetical protein